MFHRTPFSFGLDIGDAGIKVLQLRGARASAVAFAEVALPPGIVERGEIKDATALAVQIRAAIKNARIKSTQVVASLPEAKTFMAMLRVLGDGHDALHARVETELQKHIPYELGEVWWDYTVVSEDATTVSVLAGAAPRTLTDSYTGAIMAAGLTPIALDLEALAIARAIVPEGPRGGCTLIADLGATKSTLALTGAASVIATADGRSAGDALTATIAKTLGIELDAAENMKRAQGLSGVEARFHAVLEAYAQNLARRISALGEFSAYHETCPATTEILLTGGGALLKGLPEYLSGALKIPVRLGNPRPGAKGHNPKDGLPESGVRFVTAYGLAMTALNYSHV